LAKTTGSSKQIFEIEKTSDNQNEMNKKKKSSKQKNTNKSSKDSRSEVCGLDESRTSRQHNGNFKNRRGFSRSNKSYNERRSKSNFSNRACSSQDAPDWLNQLARLVTGQNQNSRNDWEQPALNVSARPFVLQSKTAETVRVQPVD
jgi:hypothetical protein